MTQKTYARPITLLVALALMALTLVIVILRMQPPKAKNANAPPEQFSAGRAAATLNHLLGEEAPHPTGTDRNETVKNAIIAEMNALGYQVKEQEATTLWH